MKKIFQKWPISNTSDDFLTITGLLKPIRRQDAVKLLPPVLT